MFSKIFVSAKDLFRSDLENEPSTPSQQLRRENAAMVTTRGRARENFTNGQAADVNEDSTIVEDGTPLGKKGRTSKRKQQTIETENEVDITPRTKRGRKLPVREKDEDSTVKESHLAVEIPTAVLTEAPEESHVVRSQKEEVQKSSKNGDAPKSSKTTVTITTPASSKHKRFGSEEPVTQIIDSTVTESVQPVDNEEQESSDDDAPEEVTTIDASKAAKEKARETAKVVEEQAAATRKKRQEKDILLKRQAEISNKKRKHEIDTAKDEMLPPAQKTKVEQPTATSTISSIAERENMEVDDVESNTLEGDGTADGRLEDDSDIEEINRTFAPRLSHLPLPDLLPAEYLEDDDEEDFASEPRQVSTNPPKRSKLRDLIEKRPKDRKIGSTTYRVAESQSTHLPPKVSNEARFLKESWLQGRPGSKIKPNRKPLAKGFFTSKK